jgi:protein tyrosine phosphatase (PTP) superfamily phosphohydrolase (DUF442 family)
VFNRPCESAVVSLTVPARRLLAVFVSLLLVLGTGAWELDRTRIRPVVPGQVYRSGQPSPSTLRHAREDLGIKSVLNLRGPNPHEAWYREEIEACRRLGLEHVDLRLQSDQTPPRLETRALVEMLDRLSRPILLHCEGGAHRSAWAAAVARAVAGYSHREVMEELSPLNRHFCIRSHCPAHRFFRSYDQWLAESGQRHSEAVFRRWVTSVYCPEPYDAEMAFLIPPASGRVRGGELLNYRVAVTNRSSKVWNVGTDPRHGIRLGVRMIGPFKSPPANPLAIFRTPAGPARDVYRAPSAEMKIAPLGRRIWDVRLEVPKEPGFYAVQFDMIDEGKHWFSDLGTNGLIVFFQVMSDK